jgi:hypothetical protein
MAEGISGLSRMDTEVGFGSKSYDAKPNSKVEIESWLN